MNAIKEQLILDLRRIRANNDRLNADEDIHTYLDLMLEYIGDTVFELREKLICSLLVYFYKRQINRVLFIRERFPWI